MEICGNTVSTPCVCLSAASFDDWHPHIRASGTWSSAYIFDCSTCRSTTASPSFALRRAARSCFRCARNAWRRDTSSPTRRIRREQLLSETRVRVQSRTMGKHTQNSQCSNHRLAPRQQFSVEYEKHVKCMNEEKCGNSCSQHLPYLVFYDSSRTFCGAAQSMTRSTNWRAPNRARWRPSAAAMFDASAG